MFASINKNLDAHRLLFNLQNNAERHSRNNNASQRPGKINIVFLLIVFSDIVSDSRIQETLTHADAQQTQMNLCMQEAQLK